jgi:hypothetical protein
MGLGAVLIVSSIILGRKTRRKGEPGKGIGQIGGRGWRRRREEYVQCAKTPILASNPTKAPAPTSQASRASFIDRLSTAAAAIERILPATARNVKEE